MTLELRRRRIRIGFPLTVVLLVAGALGAAEVSETQRAHGELGLLEAEIESLVDAGRFDEAEKLGRDLLSQVTRELGAESLEAARVIERLVSWLQKAGRDKEPETSQLLERAVAIRQQFPESDQTPLGLDLFDLAVRYHNMGDGPRTLARLESALPVLLKTVGEDHPQAGRCLAAIGISKDKSGDHDGAIAYLERAIPIIKKHFGDDSQRAYELLNNLGGAYLKTGRYDEAAATLTRALVIAERLDQAGNPVPVGLIRAAVNLLDVLYLGGDFARSAELIAQYQDRVLQNAEQRGVGENNNENIAFVEKCVVAGLNAQAIEILEHMVAKLERDDDEWLPEILRRLAASDFDLGNMRRSRDLLERADQVHRRHGTRTPWRATVLAELCLVEQALGDLRSATRRCDEADAILEQLDADSRRASLQTALGARATLRWTLGAFDEALRDFEEIARLIDESQVLTGNFDPRQDSADLSNYADFLESVGDRDGASRQIERALALSGERFTLGHPDLARIQAQAGEFYARRGDMHRARELLETALPVLETKLGAGHFATAAALSAAGTVDVAEGRIDRASERLGRALRIQEHELGAQHLDVVETLKGLATVAAAAGRLEEALALTKRQLDILIENVGPEHPDVAETFVRRSRLQLRAGAGAEAIESGLHAERIAREHFTKTARTLSEREALEYATVRPSAVGAMLTALTSEANWPPDRVQEVWDAMIRSRALVLAELSERHRSLGSTDTAVRELHAKFTEVTARLSNLFNRGAGRMSPEGFRALIRQVSSDRERYEHALARKSEEFRRQVTHRAIGLPQVLEALPLDAGLVGFARYERQPPVTSGTAVPSYLAFVVNKSAREPVVIPLGDAEKIDRAVRRWRESAGVKPSPLAEVQAEESCRAAGVELRKLIWDPIVAAIGKTSRVFVVPDSELNLINLAALPRVNGGYLIESGPLLHVLTTERDLVAYRERDTSGSGLLAVGGVDFFRRDATSSPGQIASAVPAGVGEVRGRRSRCRDFADRRFLELPWSGEEGREITSLWKETTGGEQATFLTGSMATETSFRLQAPGRRILHLSTHGFFVGDECVSGSVATATGPEDPLLLTGLVFAGANEHDATIGDIDDGVLTAQEIATLDLRGSEWAVLSACETGLGVVRSGEGVLGLRRAFQTAGARTIIMSLWTVGDQRTYQWMSALYDARLRKGMTAPEAAQDASRVVLADRRENGESTHPYYWAAMVAAGDWH